MEFYAEDELPPERPPTSIWTQPPARSRRLESHTSYSAVSAYLKSLLSIKPNKVAAKKLKVSTQSKSMIDLMDYTWYGAAGDEDDSDTPSSRGSAGSFEAEYFDVNEQPRGGPATPGLQGARRSAEGRRRRSTDAVRVGPRAPGAGGATPAKPPLPRAGSNVSRTDSAAQRVGAGGDVSSRDVSRANSFANAGLTSAGASAGASAGLGSAPPARSDSGNGMLRRLGTWAERMTHFGGKSAPESVVSSVAEAPLEEAAGSAPAEGPTAGGPGPRPPAEAGLGDQAGSTSGRKKVQIAGVDAEDVDDDVENVRKAAWRWRFTRRWQQEQAKQLDPNFAIEGNNEVWDEAIGYMRACEAGGLVNGVLARTTSDIEERALAGAAHSLGGPMLLFSDSQNERGPLKQRVELDATKQLAQVAKRARDLAVHQQQIERQIDDEWGRAKSMGGRWVGDDIDVVEVDLSGRFPFILAAVRDAKRNLSQNVVRGHARSTEAELLQAIHFEAVSYGAGSKHPEVAIELLGSGTLEWGPDTKVRRLDVVDAKTVGRRSDPRVKTSADVARTAANLLVAALPRNHRIMVDGARVT